MRQFASLLLLEGKHVCVVLLKLLQNFQITCNLLANTFEHLFWNRQVIIWWVTSGFPSLFVGFFSFYLPTTLWIIAITLHTATTTVLCGFLMSVFKQNIKEELEVSYKEKLKMHNCREVRASEGLTWQEVRRRCSCCEMELLQKCFSLTHRLTPPPFLNKALSQMLVCVFVCADLSLWFNVRDHVCLGGQA